MPGSAEEAQAIVAAIRRAVEAHEPGGGAQWYVDEFVVDVDADEFWRVALSALARTEGRPQPVAGSGSPGQAAGPG
jgi:hypothetical protein